MKSIFIDITGLRFNHLTVIQLYCGDYCVRTKWECKCDCGNTCIATGKELRNFKRQSCGKCLKRGRQFNDLTGQRFGMLTVESLHIRWKGYGSSTKWNCVCDCGNHTVVFTSNLSRGHTQSCGCLQRERTSKAKTIHGCYAKNERLAGIWEKMISRCHNPKDESYFKYGGRGITVCDEWRNSIKTFFDWAMANGYEDTLTIDRRENNGIYEPTNCRWVTVQVNSQNTRRSIGVDKVIEIKKLLKQKMPIKKIGKLFGIRHGTISSIKTGRIYSNIIVYFNK